MSVKKAKKILARGGVAVLPTDTIYGIHALAFNKKAVKKVYELKKRGSKKPFIILVSSIADLKKFKIEIDTKTKNFLKKNWPAKLSVILPCPAQEFKYLHRGKKSLAFRIPAKKDLASLLEKVGPLISTSVNPEGLAPAKTIKEAKKYFKDKIDIYIDQGSLDSEPSTVIKIENQKIKVLRKGKLNLGG